jgi:ABC-type amino acid transport substrate-binding protein
MNWVRMMRTLAPLFGLWFGLSAVAAAACERDYVVATTGDLGYNAFRGESGRLEGISVDLFAELSRRTGCKITLEEMPAARIRALDRIGAIAMVSIAADIFKEGRIYVPLIAATTDLIVRRRGISADLGSLRDDRNVVFGRVEGLTYGKWGDEFFERLGAARVDPSISPDALYRKLAIGRVDATFGFSILYQRDLDRYGLRDTVTTVPVPDAPRTLGGVLMTPWQFDPEDLKLLQAELRSIRDDGTFLHILTRWVGADVARDQVWRAARDRG